MTRDDDDLKLRLLRLILADSGCRSRQAAELNEAEWLRIDGFAGQHRLRPLLHRLSTSAAHAWPVPADMAARWRDAHQRGTRRYWRQLGAMAEIAQCLQQEGIAFAFLKGSALVTGLYQDPAVRPLRDLDLLVLPKQAEQAAALLRGALGFVHPDRRRGLIPEDYALHKHLEPLYSPHRRVTVEIHRRLADRPAQAHGETTNDILLLPERLLGATRSVQVGPAQVQLLDWPETLLHLVAHAVHDHQLNVGPLILCDAELILTRTQIDLGRFWSLATAAGRAQAAALLFAVMQSCGSEAAGRALRDAGLGDLPPEVVEAAALLLLQDTGRGLAVGSWARVLAGASLAESVSLAIARWQHLRGTVKRTGMGHDDVRLSVPQRLLAMAGAVLNPADRREIRRNKAVVSWLSQAGPDANRP